MTVFSLKEKKIKHIFFEAKSFIPNFISVIDSSIYIIGKSGKDHIEIFNIDSSTIKHHASVIVNDLFPISFNLFNNSPILLLGERNSIGVVYYLWYNSKARNNNGEKVEIPTSVFSPFLLWGNTLWGYNINGYFYTFNVSN